MSNNRKKKLQKGIDSLQEQIKFHEQKLKDAEESGEIELAGYYKKEIEFSLKKQKRKKQSILDKQ